MTTPAQLHLPLAVIGFGKAVRPSPAPTPSTGKNVAPHRTIHRRTYGGTRINIGCTHPLVHRADEPVPAASAP